MTSHSPALELKENQWLPFSLKKPIKKYPHVEMRMKFTREKLILHAEVFDTHLRDGDRSWRYGDGFFINFITRPIADESPSERVTSYGFSQLEGKSKTTLIYKNGTYYLADIENLVSITPNLDKNLIEYSIEIPWDRLAPLNPIYSKSFGLNVIYNSQNADGSRTSVALMKDKYYDHEIEKQKKYQTITLKLDPMSKFDIGIKLDRNLMLTSEINGKIVITSPNPINETIQIDMIDNNETIVDSFTQEIHMQSGMHIQELRHVCKNLSGCYSMRVTYSGGTYISLPFALLDLTEFSTTIKKELMEPNENETDGLKISALTGLRFHYQDLQAKIDDFDYEDLPQPILNQFSTFMDLYHAFLQQGHYYINRSIARTAFTSSIDQTLQPYSLAFPKDFDPKQPRTLFVALHGSGVDEVGYIKFVREKLKFTPFLIAAPRGRHLSDYYVGDSAVDVKEMILSLKNTFNIDRMFLFGFSMGGYGAWRISFLYPEFFEGVMIFSGAVKSNGIITPKQELHQMIPDQSSIPYLVVHGTADRSISFDSAKKFVELCQRKGMTIHFEEIPGGGHGNYEVNDIMIKWFSSHS